MKDTSTFSYYRLGKDAVESDADEIIEMATAASLAEQQKQVQENIHSQVASFCEYMDSILLPTLQTSDKNMESSAEKNSRRSGLSLAIGRSTQLSDHPGK